MTVIDAKFSTFNNGGNLADSDIVVGLRNGINTKFVYVSGLSTFLPLAGGTMSGVIAMGNNKITGLATPTDSADAVTKAYADALVPPLAPISSLTVLSNVTGGAAEPVGNTMTAILDAAIGSTQGDVIYRNGTVWTVLAPSTNGYFLQTQGAGANPQWAAAAIGSFLPLAGGTMSGAIAMGTSKITGMGDPTLAQDAATKAYVDSTALNGTSVYATTAANLTVTQAGAGAGATLTNAGAQATFSIDGVSPPVGVNVLIKDIGAGGTAANYGIYTVTDAGSGVTNWVLTRASSYDTVTEINNTGLILIQNGSTLAGTSWYNSATIVTVDTTAFVYTQFGNIIYPISLTNGGTNKSLTASNGGLVYSDADSFEILAGTATAGQIPRSGANSAPTWSTATYPSTAGTSGNVLTSDGTNFVSSAVAASTGFEASLLLGGM